MKKDASILNYAFIFGLLLLFSYSCEKEESKRVAQLTTTGVTEITQTTALSGGNITDDGGAPVTARGLCWSKNPTPTVNDSKTTNGNGVGSFSCTIPGLEPNTSYYVRAYATNSEGTSFGSETSFKTLEAIKSPSLTTTEVTEIRSTTANSGGEITDDGGTTITARGVCWSKGETPTISDSKTENGINKGNFTSNITDLTPKTTYFIRAYATNSKGTNYGNVISFKTLDLPILTTAKVAKITQTTAVSGGNITDDGGAAITARGVCWNTSETPTIADNKTEDGEGIGDFISNIIGLTSSTTYYVRAYTTNSEGTSYGNAISFITLEAIDLPTIATTEATDVTEVTQTTAVFAGKIPDDGGAAITARGVCWSISQNPTINDNKTVDGEGIGSFFSNITGLAPSTTYYVRVYATNSEGTSYGNAISFSTMQDYATIEDVEGNVYKIVTIGTQTWMGQNLKTTKFNDGANITLVSDSASWGQLSTPAYCWYGNNKDNYGLDYGALYNWFTVNTGKLCPTGWHVPSDAEWTTLANHLGGEWVAGSKLKETGFTYWLSPNSAATNEFGFSARAGGQRFWHGQYIWLKTSSNWWTTDEYDYFSAAKYRQIYYFSATTCPLKSDSKDKQTGLSIRCIRD